MGKALGSFRKFAAQCLWRGPNKLGARAFCRGAAGAITQTHGSFSLLLTLGRRHLDLLRDEAATLRHTPLCWIWSFRSAAHVRPQTLYLELGRDEANALASMLIEAPQGEPPDGR